MLWSFKQCNSKAEQQIKAQTADTCFCSLVKCSVLTSTPAAVCEGQCFIFAARPLQLTAAFIAPPVWATHRLTLRPWANGPAVTVSVSNEPLQTQTHKHVLLWDSEKWQHNRYMWRLLKRKLLSFGLLSSRLLSLSLNKGCFELNVRLSQTKVQIGLMGHLYPLTALSSSNARWLLCVFVQASVMSSFSLKLNLWRRFYVIYLWLKTSSTSIGSQTTFRAQESFSPWSLLLIY